MSKSVLCAPLVALTFGSLAFSQGSAPTKVGIIHAQNAIAQTKEGQKAVGELESRFLPKRKELEKMQTELQQSEQQYRSGANTMSEEARQRLSREIDQKRKVLQREMDDAQAELEQEQQRILQELGNKMIVVIDKYAKDNGFALILDVSSPQTPVLFASNTIDITADIVGLYDKGASLPAPAAAPPATSAAPGTPAPKPPATNAAPGTPAAKPPTATPPKPAASK